MWPVGSQVESVARYNRWLTQRDGVRKERWIRSKVYRSPGDEVEYSWLFYRSPRDEVGWSWLFTDVLAILHRL